MAHTQYVDKDTFKAYIGLSGTAQDDNIDTAIDSACRLIDKICGRRFYQDESAVAKVFTPNNTPGLNHKIDKVLVNIHNITFHEQSNILSSLGAKYAPCILFKMRMIGIEEHLTSYKSNRITSTAEK